LRKKTGAPGRNCSIIIDLTDRALPDFTAEVAQADEFATWLATSAEGGLGKIAANLELANIDVLWVVGTDGKVRRQIASPKVPVAPAFPLEAGEFVRLVADTPSPRFFAASGNQLFELCIRRVTASTSAERAWVMGARRWDDTQLRPSPS